MNIQQQSQLKAVIAKVDEIENLPHDLNQALKRMDQAIEDFSYRIGVIEKQHQAVLDNVQYLKDLISGVKDLPNKRRYEQKRKENEQRHA